MAPKRVDWCLEGQIRALLKLRMTQEEIIEVIKRDNGPTISRFKIYKVKKRMEEGKENYSPKKRGCHVMTDDKLKRMKELFKDVKNPPLHRDVAKELNVSHQLVTHHLHKTCNLKMKMKKKVQRLNDSQMLKRFERSPALLKIIKNNLIRIVTSDESKFCVSLGSGDRDFYYIERGTKDKDEGSFSPSEPKQVYFKEREEHYSVSVMVWGAISWHGKSELIFIEPGVKINSKYYQEKVIENFMCKDRKKLFRSKEFLWHQDSAPSHVSKDTINYLNENSIKFITKDQWIPKSPDAAPMDYYVWGWMKNRIRKREIKTKEELKQAILETWDELPLESIRNALKAWTVRLQKIIDAKGGHF